jgi:hypothetical protein
VDTAAVALLLAVLERMNTCEVTGLMCEWTHKEETTSEFVGWLFKQESN